MRPGAAGDVPRLLAILREAEVATRWGSHWSEDDVVKEFVGADNASVIVVDDEVIGAIRFDEENDPMYRHAGIDVFITAPRHGQGLGSDAVRTLARYLIEERGHHRLTIDPAVDNERAIRAYRRVGFREVGVMREYERGADGTWHDGLLMEMLADASTTDDKRIVRRGTIATGRCRTPAVRNLYRASRGDLHTHMFIRRRLREARNSGIRSSPALCDEGSRRSFGEEFRTHPGPWPRASSGDPRRHGSPAGRRLLGVGASGLGRLGDERADSKRPGSPLHLHLRRPLLREPGRSARVSIRLERTCGVYA